MPNPRVVVEPPTSPAPLHADPVARAAYDRLSDSHKRQYVLAYREREEGRDAHTADRQRPGNAAGPGVGSGPRGPRQDSSNGVDPGES